ncbi:MAG: Rrf2 family transcriptional regulator [Thermoflavifilum sp.]|nr:Rrf2 family transcriptional regulator [Thermoflavifilum sp.]
MFSKSCEYAIRAVIYIAHQSRNGKKVSIREVAQGIDSPLHFIAKILQYLSKRNIIQSTKGPNGGFYLDKRAMKQTLEDVVIAMDGDQVFEGCALGLRYCSESRPCPLHEEFKQIREQIRYSLQSTTIAQFAEEDAHKPILKR